MRKTNHEKETKKQEEERKAKGDRYQEERLLIQKPPSFVSKTKVKKQLLLSIEVSITPTKTGRIGIKEGDDLHLLAASFCKAY